MCYARARAWILHCSERTGSLDLSGILGNWTKRPLESETRMLSETFLKELNAAVPGARVTGVVSWQASWPAGSAETILAATRIAKRPLLDAARACPDVRVNPLDGAPHSILDASAEGWQKLQSDNPGLLEDEALTVDANSQVFRALPAP